MNDHSSAPLIDVLRSTSYLLDLYGYSGHYPSLDELQHMIGRAIANLEDASISEASPSPAPTALQIRLVISQLNRRGLQPGWRSRFRKQEL